MCILTQCTIRRTANPHFTFIYVSCVQQRSTNSSTKMSPPRSLLKRELKSKHGVQRKSHCYGTALALRFNIPLTVTKISVNRKKCWLSLLQLWQQLEKEPFFRAGWL